MINIILILSIAVNVLLTAIVLLFIFRIKNLEDKYYSFIAKFDGNRSIEEVMNSYMKMVKNVNEDNKIIKANILNVERQLNMCVQNIGMVRYNAFDDVGSELSFAIAMLDNEDNGFVINSIYGRTSSNVYAKTIENGTSKVTLSDEEIKAVNKAKEHKKL
jgi:hypothetical protein